MSEFGQWVSVEERLPDKPGWVLTFTNSDFAVRFFGGEDEGFCRTEWDERCGWEPGETTHWMPLPEGPSESRT